MSSDSKPVHGRPSDEAAREKTGRDWREWFELLDQKGGTGMSHKEIVAELGEVGSTWWRQGIAVEYEKARGLRVIGQTSDGGFQVGVSRTFALSAADTYELLVAHPEVWLGPGATVSFEKGETYEVPAGDGEPAAGGEIRVVKPGDRLRLTWHPEGWERPATMQIALDAKAPEKTSVTFHVEKLPDLDAREALRAKGKAALAALAELATA